MAGGRGGTRPPIGRTVYARAVSIDTGALLALADNADQHHAAAEGCLKTIAAKRLPLYLPIPTLYETHRRILFDLGEDRALRFLKKSQDGSLNIIRPTREDEEEGQRIIEEHRGAGFTLTDAVNMAMMIRLGIGTVFSFDHHFLILGFNRIPPFSL